MNRQALTFRLRKPWSTVTNLEVAQYAVKCFVILEIMPKLITLPNHNVQYGLENNCFGTQVIFWIKRRTSEEFHYTINFDINVLDYSRHLSIMDHYMLDVAFDFYMSDGL